jgi:seryl-tRNA synthetase
MSLSSEGLHRGLVENELIFPVGVPGAFGRGPVFEDVLHRFDALVSRVAADDRARKLVFPPVIDRAVLERSDFLDSFPQLAGTVSSFMGDSSGHAELSARVHGGRPWHDLLSMTGVVLNPAACYPLYPLLTGALPPDGCLVDMQNWVFRHEPSREPTRMQSFRVREFVRAGVPSRVVAWRDEWLERGRALLQSLGLAASAETASDPFFGRGGRMLAAAQRELELKFEVVVPVVSDGPPTAVCSFNCHQDHFGKAFRIHTADGETAHTACLGFGLERVVIALFATHGFDVAKWPSSVRAKLWV